MDSTEQARSRPWELLLAGRLLRSERSAHLSVISAMSVAGIALGVAALIVVLAVNTGFQHAFQERILATYPHAVVMRRGVDLPDWRDVRGRLAAAPGVTSASPATYDDMMLSSDGGRAGAVVRGVPAPSLAALPEGVVVDGAVDTRGEAPLLLVDDAAAHTATVAEPVAGARHVVVFGGPEPLAVPVVSPRRDEAEVLLVDMTGCGGDARQGGPLVLREPIGETELRRVQRGGCGPVARWSVMTGPYEVVADGEVLARLDVRVGAVQTVVIGGRARLAALVVPPPDDVPAQLAAVALANVGERPWHVTVAAAGAGDAAEDGDAKRRAMAGGTAQRFDVPPLAAAPAATWWAGAGTLPAIALGEGLAERLRVSLGDEVRAVSPLRGIDRGEAVASSSAAGRFRVAAILRSGFHDHDQRLALVDFSAAQRFLGRGDVARWVDLRLDDPLLAKRRAPRLQAALQPETFDDLLLELRDVRHAVRSVAEGTEPGLSAARQPASTIQLVDGWSAGLRAMRRGRRRPPQAYRVIDWEQMNQNVFDAARLQKVAMSLFPFIIVLVAALNVVGTQAVVVREREREIAILRAMGATRTSVGTVFLTQGFAVGAVGTLCGLLVGGAGCLLLSTVGYPLDPNVYLISELPVVIEPGTFLLAGGSATLLTFGASWWAARRAASRSPVDGLRRLD